MTTVKFTRQPLQRGFNSLFDEFFNEFPGKWGKDWNGQALPAVNIHENTEGLDIELNAPGRSKEDFKINVAEGVLTIGFEKKEVTGTKEHKPLRREFSIGSFTRSFNLGEDIDADNIQAKYENGILKLYLPKKPVVKESIKQINIQ